MRHALLILLLALLGTGCDLFGGDDTDVITTDPEWLYVAVQDAAEVAVIDMTTNGLDRVIDLTAYGFSEGAKPHHVAVEPDGSFWYVSLIGESQIAKFDREDALVGTAAFETPGMLAVHPTRDLLAVGRSMSAVNPPSSLGLIRRSDLSVEEVPVVFPRPHALAFSPQGTHVYTASLAENQLMAVDLASREVTFTPVGGLQRAYVHFAVAPDRPVFVATSQLADVVDVFDASNPAQPQSIGSGPARSAPWHPVFSPDGRIVYFGEKGANTASALDLDAALSPEGGAIGWTVQGEGFAQPHGSALSPDGRWLYISNPNTNGTYVAADGSTPGTVVVVDTERRAVETVIEVGAGPTGLGTR